jgi:hypothetical protein
MSPIADNEHQAIVMMLTAAFYDGIFRAGLGQVLPGANVSDRIEGWTKNYRTPDVVVILKDSPAQNHGRFWTGPVDFLVEIVSRGDRSRRKLPFYSRIGVREALFVDRSPWRLSLYRHNGVKLEPAARCECAGAAPLPSEVLPFSFGLVAAEPRPTFQLTHIPDGRTWQA